MELFEARPPRQLVVCCDGTNKTLTGGVADTNVLHLFEHLAHGDDAQQLRYYDPGVGAPDALPSIDPGDWIARRWARISGLAFGRGVFENIGMAYRFLARHYQPGDQIFLFGFSRGAFTVRCVAGMINLFGLVRSEHLMLMPTLLRVYFSKMGTAGIERGAASSSAPLSREAVAAQIQNSFSNPAARDAVVHFIGVWDTVASVGLPPFALQISSNATVRGKCFRHVRQALALDEHRRSFLPRVFSENNFGDAHAAQSLTQLWFRGVHSDVGGGYPAAQDGLAAITLRWMVDEARACGLRCAPLPNAAPDQALAHDPVFVAPLWAALGLGVRDSRASLGTDGSAKPVTPVAHVSATQAPPASVWQQRRSPLVPLLLLVTTAMLSWLSAQAMAAAGKGDALRPLGALARAIWIPADAQAELHGLDLPQLRIALLTGLVALPFVGALFAIPVSRAFTRALGWRRVGSGRPWFAPLGGALPLALGAGALAPLSALLALWRAGAGTQAVLLWLCSGAGWLALAGVLGCAVLLVAGLKKGPQS